MANGKRRAERKQMLIRLVSLVLAGLMIFSVVLAAALTQVF